MSIRKSLDDIHRIMYGEVTLDPEHDAGSIISVEEDVDDANLSSLDVETTSGIPLIDKLNMIIDGEEIHEDEKEDNDENINESASKLNPSIMESITKKVKYNDYTGALRLAAKMLGSEKLEKQFELINELQGLDGSLNSNLEKYRMDLSKEIDSIAEKNLSKDDYRSFNRAF